MVFGVGGSNGAICGSIKSKMVAGGHLGMMALSRVSLASAGLSCFMILYLWPRLSYARLMFIILFFSA